MASAASSNAAQQVAERVLGEQLLFRVELSSAAPHRVGGVSIRGAGRCLLQRPARRVRNLGHCERRRPVRKRDVGHRPCPHERVHRSGGRFESGAWDCGRGSRPI